MAPTMRANSSRRKCISTHWEMSNDSTRTADDGADNGFKREPRKSKNYALSFLTLTGSDSVLRTTVYMANV